MSRFKFPNYLQGVAEDLTMLLIRSTFKPSHGTPRVCTIDEDGWINTTTDEVVMAATYGKEKEVGYWGREKFVTWFDKNTYARYTPPIEEDYDESILTNIHEFDYSPVQAIETAFLSRKVTYNNKDFFIPGLCGELFVNIGEGAYVRQFEILVPHYSHYFNYAKVTFDVNGVEANHIESSSESDKALGVDYVIYGTDWSHLFVQRTGALSASTNERALKLITAPHQVLPYRQEVPLESVQGFEI